jgi:Tol biopolymer transport system component
MVSSSAVRSPAFAVGPLAVSLLAASGVASALPPTVELASTPADPLVLGRQPVDDAFGCDLSRDGRTLVFQSAAWNLVPGDTNREQDVFVLDRLAGTLERVVAPDGRQLERTSAPRLSGDGRWLLFSTSESLSVQDTNTLPDLYLWSRDDGSIELASRDGSGAAVGGSFGSLSGDARYVAFLTSAAAVLGSAPAPQVVRLDRDTGVVAPVSIGATAAYGNASASSARIIGTRYVAFRSTASDLVAGDTNGVQDVFVRDFVAGITRRVSVDSTGAQLPLASSLVGGGIGAVPTVVFSTASVVVAGDSNAIDDLFRIRLDNGNVVHLSPRVGGGFRSSGQMSGPANTQDGERAIWSGLDGDWDAADDNAVYDTFLSGGATSTRALSAPTGTYDADGFSSAPCADQAGTTTAFHTDATNLVAGDTNGAKDILLCEGPGCVLDRVALAAAPVPLAVARGDSRAPDVSADGRYVVFETESSHLVADGIDAITEPDVILRDRLTGENVLITPGNEGGIDPVVSDDGRFVAYRSIRETVPRTQGGPPPAQAMLFDRQTAMRRLISAGPGGVPADASVQSVAIAGDGSTVVFDSAAGNLVAGDVNGAADVFIHDVASGALARAAPPGAIEGGGNAPRVSRDGRRVVFAAYDSDYVAGDDNSSIDVFVHDRTTQSFVRVSLRPGIQGDNDSEAPDIADDGSTVVFSSRATNLVDPPVSSGGDRVYRVPFAGGLPVLVGTRPEGTPFADADNAYAPRMSADGAVVVHWINLDTALPPGATIAGPVSGLLVRSSAGLPSEVVSMAPDGRWVPDASDPRAFAIDAAAGVLVLATDSGDLLPTLDHNGDDDVYVLVRNAPVDAVFADGFEPAAGRQP